jgi:formylglycine-generating enzyme required for sulfatase activity
MSREARSAAATDDGAVPAGMLFLPGGEFTMGSDRHYPEEAPAHRVAVDSFLIDSRSVTNDDFAAFVSATGYVTFAQRAPDPTDYPGADPAMLVPASAVFTPPDHPVRLDDAYQWWSSVPGADWRHPRGPGTSLHGLGEHPVVHVAFADAAAYAAWAGKDLPTEAEWEYAARGGTEGTEFAWGDELTVHGGHMANTWQGSFPLRNDEEDGYYWTSPVGVFPPNAYGLYDMIGNVWEWTADWWSTSHRPSATQACCAPVLNPAGGKRTLSVDIGQPLATRVPRKVIKGGSYLCAPNYCRRYRPPARQPQAIDTTTGHVGFRCVVRTPATG